MQTRKPLSAKIVVGSHGLGVPDPDLIQRRAWEVAEIQAHEVPTAADWDEARRELHGRATPAEGTPSNGTGFSADIALLGSALVFTEEASLGEELIREGMEEAEHERMLLARKETEEP